MFCENCGKESSDTKKYCRYCGTSLGYLNSKEEVVMVGTETNEQEPEKNLWQMWKRDFSDLYRGLKETGNKKILLGLLFVFVGFAFTWFSYVSTEPGGRYRVAVGVILFGAVLIVRGMSSAR